MSHDDIKSDDKRLTDAELIQRLATVVIDSNDAIILLDMWGNILAWNHGAEKIYGYPEAEALKMNILSIVPESEKAPDKEMMDRLRRGEVVRSFETERVTRDGRVLDIWLTTTVLKDKDGRPYAISTTERNITHIKYVEKDLKDKNHVLDAVLEIVTSAFRTLELDNLLYTILNTLVRVMKADAAVMLLHEEAGERFYMGVGVEAVRTREELIPFGVGCAGSIAATKKPMYVEDAQQGQCVISEKLKSLGIRTLLGVPMVSNGNIVGVVHVDWLKIHPFSELEQQILLASAERCAMAIMNSRLYMKTVELKRQAELYLDVMGHDINNLNQVALFNLEFVMKAGSLNEKQVEALNDVINAINGSASIIRNVRKIQAITQEKKVVHSEDLDELINLCIAEAPKPPGRKVTINYTPRKGLMVCGTALMKEAFCNIINNAIRHSKKDVTIDIAVEETTRDGKKFYDTIISDNGPGIPNELKAKIFNRFQRGETKAHGRGLGLFIVHSLVERAGGNVSAEDRIPGDYTKGAKFVVSLPAAEECK
jgi:PAS domain S-box-containing protein